MNPAGMDYIPGFGFVVSSQTYGNTYFLEDYKPIQLFANRNPIAVGGAAGPVRVDTRRKLIYVGYYDLPSSRNASIVAYDRVDGTLRGNWDFSGLLASVKVKGLGNIREDTLGNLYATDTQNGIIYKADRNGETSVWLQDPQLESQDALQIGALGLEYISSASTAGVLIVGRAGITEKQGGLFRVDVATKNLQRITLNKGLFSGAFGIFGGMAFNSRSGRLFVTGSSDNTVYEFSSSDNWLTADLKAQHLSRCITPLSVQYVQSPYNDIYVLCASVISPYAEVQRLHVDKINVIPYIPRSYVSSSDSDNSGSTIQVTSAVIALISFVILCTM